jgi:hypothetical protein
MVITLPFMAGLYFKLKASLTSYHIYKKFIQMHALLLNMAIRAHSSSAHIVLLNVTHTFLQVQAKIFSPNLTPMCQFLPFGQSQ